jgi:fucose 4-O-acetylase-like acetyltransferase
LPGASTSPQPAVALRVHWVDQLRGLTILMIVVGDLIPEKWQTANPVLAFFLTHAPRQAHHVNFTDLRASIFIFIMGLMVAYSFRRRCAKLGTRSTCLHMVRRYGVIFSLGILATVFGHGSLIRTVTLDDGSDLRVLYWDVLPTLGWVGLLGIPFMFLRPGMRLISAYLLLAFYQVMLSNTGTGWQVFALNSVHGGVFAATFSFGAQLITASVLGEYVFRRNARGPKVRAALVIFGATHLVAGFVVASLPGVVVSKGQVTAAYSLISMGVAGLLCWAFLLLDERDKTSVLLEAAGRNTLLIYLLMMIAEFLLFDVFLEGSRTQVQALGGLVAILSIVGLALLLWRKNKFIRPERVALVSLIILVVLAVALIPTGVVKPWER